MSFRKKKHLVNYGSTDIICVKNLTYDFHRNIPSNSLIRTEGRHVASIKDWEMSAEQMTSDDSRSLVKILARS